MRLRHGLVSLILVTAAAAGAAADGERPADSLALARELYSAAEYENALGVLERLRQTSAVGKDDRESVDEYRAFCLLALGRSTDAEQVVASLVMADPTFVPADTDLSPRLRTVFRDVRRRTLPAAIQQQYDTAKAAFDRHEFALAAVGFSGVLRVIADPDVAEFAGAPPIADIKTLAEGFRALSTVAAAPPPPPPSPLPPAVEAPPTAPSIYTGDDPSVSAPVVVKQQLPPFSSQYGPAHPGVVELVINEQGQVESVAIRSSINPRYDRLVLDAARSWKYQPATRSGMAVKYRKVVQVTVKTDEGRR
jgi:TonB family protein